MGSRTKRSTPPASPPALSAADIKRMAGPTCKNCGRGYSRQGVAVVLKYGRNTQSCPCEAMMAWVAEQSTDQPTPPGSDEMRESKAAIQAQNYLANHKTTPLLERVIRDLIAEVYPRVTSEDWKRLCEIQREQVAELEAELARRATASAGARERAAEIVNTWYPTASVDLSVERDLLPLENAIAAALAELEQKLAGAEAENKNRREWQALIGEDVKALAQRAERAERRLAALSAVAENSGTKSANEAEIKALASIVRYPYGCPMCDCGKLRDEKRPHWSDCPWPIAQQWQARQALAATGQGGKPTE